MKNLFFLLIILCSVSCSKLELTGTDLNIEVKSRVFQCCNIWEDFVTTDNDINEAVSGLLEENRISFTDFQIVDINAIEVICELCCQCPLSTEVQFKVREQDLETVLELGFEQ